MDILLNIGTRPSANMVLNTKLGKVLPSSSGCQWISTYPADLIQTGRWDLVNSHGSLWLTFGAGRGISVVKLTTPYGFRSCRSKRKHRQANATVISFIFWKSWIPLQWRHNGHDSVSNHQPDDCLLNVYLEADQRKHQSSASLAFVQGIHRGPVNYPHKWPVTRKMFQFDDVIMFSMNDGVMQKWSFPFYWPFVRDIQRSRASRRASNVEIIFIPRLRHGVAN